MLQSVHNWTPYEPQQNTSTMSETMIVFSAMRDFADGLTRGLSLFLTERQDTTLRGHAPSTARRRK